MVSDAQKKATQKYQNDKVKTCCVKFFPSEHDLYEMLSKQPNKMGYIKSLIRADMEREAAEVQDN